MKDKGVIVYWIDESLSVQTRIISPYQLKRGHSYESEASWITSDSKHVEIIRIERAGNAEELDRVQRLKDTALALRTQPD